MLALYFPVQSWCVATSSAPAALVAGHLPTGVPPVVIQPVCVCAAVGANSVRSTPSTRTTTDVGDGAAAASSGTATAAALTTSAATLVATRLFRCMRATPFHEGV
jgi:hypothetical protein